MIPEKISLAVIGGSGLYDMTGLTAVTQHTVDTPFGTPSAPILVGMLEENRVAFLARHGLGHHIMPSEINYRANIYALKTLGVERIVGVNACGSLREDFAPGHIVIPDQIFDFTRNRNRTFFGEGLVAHVGSADPFCPQLSMLTVDASRLAGAITHVGGAFVVIEGPRFSTKAESNAFRAWGMSIVGMTCAPEAFLAREAEMCYAVMAHITDYDVWHVSEKPVTVEMVIRTLNQNTATAQQAIRTLVNNLPVSRSCSCDSALSAALITHPKVIPPETRRKLDLLVRKYLH
jgi:5'-methylthioadenosine phosphorylase